MFVKLYLLGAALALIPLRIKSKESHSRNLPLHFSENIDGPKFSTDVEVEESSHIVLVKCSNDAYPHGSTGYKFTINNYVAKYKNFVSSETSKYIWVPLLKKSSNLTRFSCGKITIKPGDVFSPMIGWTYNVKWNNTEEDIIKMNSNNMDYPLPETPDECHNGTGKLLVVSKDKENDTIVIIDPLDVKNPYPNQIFYYFIRPEQNDDRKIIEHCARYRGYKNRPKLILPDHNDKSTAKEVKVKKIHTQDSYFEKGKKIKVSLKLKNDIQFYRDEEISLSRMRYTEKGLIDIENSTEQIKSSFVIKGFDLVKLVYNHLDATGYKEVSQIYYFGPDLKNFTQPRDYKKENDPSEIPNCSIYFMNVGFLEKVIYNEKEGSTNTLNTTIGIKGRFNRTLDYIFFEEKKTFEELKDCHYYCDTKLYCIYKTFDGTITDYNLFYYDRLKFPRPQYDSTKSINEGESRLVRTSWTMLGTSMLFLLLLQQL